MKKADTCINYFVWIRREYVLFLLLLGFCSSLLAQDNQIGVKFPPSPNASGLGVYGKTNVNLYTGTPEISIPLHTVKEGPISFPISLSYNASGVRPNMKTSWVGLNWDLNCGGVITRVVKGSKQDEALNTGFFSNPDLAKSLNFSEEVTHVDPWGNEIPENELAGYAIPFDTEPDVFYFNFCGYSGKFFHNNNFNDKNDPMAMYFEVVPHQNLIINVEDGINAGQEHIYQIIIYDGYGIKYTFGIPVDDHVAGYTEAVEFSKTENPYIATGSNPNDFMLPVAWYLKEIESPQGDKVTFNYEIADVNGKYHVTWSRNHYYRQEHASSVTEFEVSFLWSTWTRNLAYKSDFEVEKYIQTSTYCSYLKSIETSTSTISFDRSNSEFALYISDLYSSHNELDQKLDRITVTDNLTGEVHKTLNLSYNEDLTGNRLRLDKVELCKDNGSCKEPYRLFYKNFNLLPGTTTSKIDIWGYFNNRAGYFPSTLENGELGNELAPNPEVCDAGLLEYLYYPTGGYTHYEYEPHEVQYGIFRVPNGFEKEEIGPQVAGGARISRITDFDGNFSTFKTYNYSEGIIYQCPELGLNSPEGEELEHYFVQGSLSAAYLNKQGVSEGEIGHFELFSSEGLFSVPEDYIGYSEVKISNSDGSSETYNYSNWDDDNDYYNDEIPQIANNLLLSMFFPISSRKLTRGKLQSILYKDQSQNPVKSIDYFYNSNISSREYQFNEHAVYACMNNFRVFTTVDIRPMSIGYVLFHYPMYLDREVEKIYSSNHDGTYVTTEKNYYYNEYNQLQEEEYSTSDGSIYNKFNLYPGDYNYSTDFTGQMKYLNIVNTPVEQYKTLNNQLVEASLTTFNTGDDIGLPNEVFKINSQTPIPVSVFTPSNESGDFVPDPLYNVSSEPEISFDFYDQGKLLQYHTKYGLPVSYTWGYANTLPIARVDNASHDEIAYTSFEDGFPDSWVLESGSITDYSGSNTGSKVISGGKVYSPVLPAGTYLVSFWGKGNPAYSSSNVLVESSINLGHPDEVSGEVVQTRVTLSTEKRISISFPYIDIDEVRIHPADALMTSYTYDPLIGVTSITDPRGQTSTYEYDELGRLMNIRDQNGDIVQTYEYNYAQ